MWHRVSIEQRDAAARLWVLVGCAIVLLARLIPDWIYVTIAVGRR